MDRTMPRRRRAFTWPELLVLLVVLAIVTALIISVVTNARTRNMTLMCSDNLRQIGQALLLYSNDNRGAYPRTRTSAGPVRIPTWGTGAAATQPFTDGNGPADNDITAALYLLLRTQDITARAFICPATRATPDTFAGLTPLQRSNFTDVKKNLSYSYQNPYASDSVITNSAWFIKYSGGINSEFAIAADINPGAAGGNSANHDVRGQNVLYADGHVAWASNALAGDNRENIYTTGDGKISASPYDVRDSILLPTADSPSGDK
jgi:prepilin-type processing-associated H-X9-DG protein